MLAFVPMMVAPCLPTAPLAMAALVFGICGGAGYTVGSIPLMQLVPSQLRGKVMVSYLLISNSFSGLFGPTLIAMLNQRVVKDPAMIGHSLSIVVGVSLAITILLLTLRLKPYRESLAAVAMRTR